MPLLGLFIDSETEEIQCDLIFWVQTECQALPTIEKLWSYSHTMLLKYLEDFVRSLKSGDEDQLFYDVILLRIWVLYPRLPESVCGDL